MQRSFVSFLLVSTAQANPFRPGSEYYQSKADSIVSVLDSSKKVRVSRDWNKLNPRRTRFEMEENFVEKDYGKGVTNELELLSPGSIKPVGATEVTRIITSISPLSIDNDEMVTVSFYSSHPSDNDWVGAYSPPDVDITKTVPVKYAWMDYDHDYNRTHHGSLRFNMTNLRQGVKFYFMINGLKNAKYANVSSQTLTFKNPNQPLRPRVVATGDPDTFTVLWSSMDSKQPVLKWRTTKSGVYTTVQSATNDHVNRQDLCGYPANSIGWFDSGLIHSAPLVGMKALAGRSLYYTFGDAATNDFFPTDFVFRVPPLAGTQPSDRPTTVVLYDDLGRGSNDDAYTWNHYGEPAFNTSKSVGALVAKGAVDAIYHGGDISYAIGYEAVWDFFLDMLVPVASGALYLTTVGNHESDWPDSGTYFTGKDSGGECGIPVLKFLPQPSPPDKTKPWAAPWWSYDVGLLHLVGMSTEHDFSVGSPQYQFLEADLRAVDRMKTPWVVFGGHRAMYLNSDWSGPVDSDNSVSDLLIAQVEPLLQKYKVNLAFWGHNHVVQRQSAVYQKKVVQTSRVHDMPVTVGKGGGSVPAGTTAPVNLYSNPQAPVHFVIGTGGAKLTYNSYTDPAEIPAWNEMVLHEWGYTLLKAHNASVLEWTWINCMTDEVADRVVITQDAAQASAPWPCPQDTQCLPDSSSTDTTASNSSNPPLSALEKGVIAGGTVAVVLLLATGAYLWLMRARKAAGAGAAMALTDEEWNNKARSLSGAGAGGGLAETPTTPPRNVDSIPSPEPVRSSSSFEVSATVSALHAAAARKSATGAGAEDGYDEDVDEVMLLTGGQPGGLRRGSGSESGAGAGGSGSGGALAAAAGTTGGRNSPTRRL